MRGIPNQCWKVSGLPQPLQNLFDHYIAKRIGNSVTRIVPNGSCESLTIINGATHNVPPFLEPLMQAGHQLCCSDESTYFVSHLDTILIDGSRLGIEFCMEKKNKRDDSVWICGLPVFACNGDSNRMYLEVDSTTAKQISACASDVIQYFVSTIPPQFYELISKLDVKGYRINKMHIGHFQNLSFIDLIRCELNEVPKGLEKLEHLILLNLRHNHLTGLGNPWLLTCWPHIEDVDLRNNNIAYLGMWYDSDRPITIYVDHNPIVNTIKFEEDECGHLDAAPNVHRMFRPVHEACDTLVMIILWCCKRGLMGLNKQFPRDIVRLLIKYVCATSHCAEWIRCLEPEGESELEGTSEKKRKVEILDE